MNIKKCAVTGLLFSVVGCAAPTHTVPEIHAKSVEQWHALSEFAGDQLQPFGYTLVGSLLIEKEAEQTSYKLVDIQIAKQASASQIDLLSLDFAGKFACSDTCHQLNQIYVANGQKLSLLTHVYAGNESDLFEFYSVVFQVNRQISQYMSRIPAEFSDYIEWLAKERESIDSLRDFTKYMDDKFSKQSVINFISYGHSDNAFKLITEINDLPVSPSEQSLPEFSMGEETEFSAPEQDNWIVPSDGVLTGDQVIVQNIIKEKEQDLVHNVEKLKNFNLLKNAPIRVGDVVCSFSDNTISTVLETETDGKVLVRTIGEAVVLTDGIRRSASPGHLYQDNEQTYLYHNNSELKYSGNNITRCNFEGIDELIMSRK